MSAWGGKFSWKVLIRTVLFVTGSGLMAAETPAVVEPKVERFTLARGGASSYRIVTGPNAAEPEQFAAAELSRYLFEISGARLPVAVENGGSDNGDAILLGSAAPDDIRARLKREP